MHDTEEVITDTRDAGAGPRYPHPVLLVARINSCFLRHGYEYIQRFLNVERWILLRPAWYSNCYYCHTSVPGNYAAGISY